MNSNKIKIVSIIALLLFAGSLTLPFFPMHASCDMACCKVSVNTTDKMDMASDDCCHAMSECRDVVLIPIVTAPILKVNPEKDLTVEYLTTVENILSFKETISTPYYHLKILTSEVHPGFQTPLLV